MVSDRVRCTVVPTVNANAMFVYSGWWVGSGRETIALLGFTVSIFIMNIVKFFENIKTWHAKV